MNKRFWSMILTLALILTMLPAAPPSVSALQMPIQEVSVPATINPMYENGQDSIIATGFCGDTVIWELSQSGVLTISGEGAMYEYVQAEDGGYCDNGDTPWSAYISLINTVIVESGVTTIGSGAFMGCPNLYSVVLPAILDSIAPYAFAECGNLTEVVWPETLERIGDCAFNQCKQLQSIYLPEGITEIPYMCFQGCESLTSIVIPESVSVIGDYAFNCCLKLQEVNLHSNLVSVGEWAFRSCGFTEIHIPASLVEMGHLAFSTMEDLDAFVVDEDNPAYCAVDGVLFSKDMSTLYVCPADKTGNYIIPEGVQHIYAGAFAICRHLTDVSIPNSVTTIGVSVFTMCEALTEVRIPSSVTHIDFPFISTCEKVENIHVDENNAMYCSVEGVLFSKDMTQLLWYPDGKNTEYYAIPEGVVSLTAHVFVYSEIRELYIPASLVSIHEASFATMEKLNAFIVHEDNANYCDVDGVLYSKDMRTLIAYPENKRDAWFRIPDGVEVIAPSAMGGPYLENITIPSSVSFLYEGALGFTGSHVNVYFEGSAPETEKAQVFIGITTATVYYPGNDPTWTEDIMASYGGNITWVAYEPEVPAHPDGWISENSSWYYYVDNVKQTGWLKSGGYWYYLDADGVMQTGWVKVNGNWFYMNKSGVMLTGWQKITGYWYYFASGGAMQTGWIQLKGNWYYLSSGGVMQTGWVYDDSYWYFMNSSGVMQKGWVSAGGKWYYMNKSGVMVTGWVKDGGYWYYMGEDGAMLTGTHTINGKIYIFNSHGVWIG